MLRPLLAALALASLASCSVRNRDCCVDPSCTRAERCAAICEKWTQALSRPPDMCLSDPWSCGKPQTEGICTVKPEECNTPEIQAFAKLRDQAAECTPCPDTQ